MYMKKRMLAAAMAAVMAVSLAGCSGGDKTTETPAGKAGTEAGKENSWSMRLSWPISTI